MLLLPRPLPLQIAGRGVAPRGITGAWSPVLLLPGPWNLEPGTGSLNLEPGTWSLEPVTWNLQPETWNLEPGAKFNIILRSR